MTELEWTVAEWTALGGVLSGLGTIIGALAVIVAAVLASNTFDSWRKQTLSQRRIEQAERILTATYKVRRGLSHVRNPMLWAFEQQKSEDYLKEKDALPEDETGRRKMIIAQLYFTRLTAVMDDRKLLEETQPMARALFGGELELAMEALNRQFQRIDAAVQAQYRFDENTNREWRENIEATLWEGYPSPEKNEFDCEIAAQVATIEALCLPALRLEN